MAKFSRKGRKRRKGWSSGGKRSFSSDEYTRYMGDLDDARMLRRDHGSRPGKTIHPHPTFTEVIEVDERAKFAGLMEEAKKGNVKAQFLLGKEYARLREWTQAEHWLTKVAELGGWPEAVEELSRVRQLKQPSTSMSVSEEHPFLKLPRIAGFEICEIVMRRGEKKYLVLVRRKKSAKAKREVMGQLLREAGFDDATDLYDTELDAQNAGLLARRSWGRLISQERETRYHLRDSIDKFLADTSK